MIFIASGTIDCWVDMFIKSSRCQISSSLQCFFILLEMLPIPAEMLDGSVLKIFLQAHLLIQSLSCSILKYWLEGDVKNYFLE